LAEDVVTALANRRRDGVQGAGAILGTGRSQGTRGSQGLLADDVDLPLEGGGVGVAV
jgi:hypothetical protein